MALRRARLARIAAVILTIAVVDYAVVHLLPGLGTAWRSLGAGEPVLLVPALVLEIASVASYSRITMALLPPDATVRYGTVLAIDVTGMGLSHVMPGGGASAAALRVRLMARRGVATADAVSTGAVEYAVILIWLIALLLLGLVVAAPDSRTLPTLRIALIIAMVLLMIIAGVVAVLIARPDEVVDVAQWTARRVPLVSALALERLARSLIEAVRLTMGSRVRRSRSLLWALSYWLFDASSLAVCLLAYGSIPNPGGFLTTYALANLLALLPITPGGLGLVEGVAVPALVSFGLRPAPALLGVLSWRALSFWLPIPVAVGLYGWLRAHPRRIKRSPTLRSE